MQHFLKARIFSLPRAIQYSGKLGGGPLSVIGQKSGNINVSPVFRHFLPLPDGAAVAFLSWCRFWPLSFPTDVIHHPCTKKAVVGLLLFYFWAGASSGIVSSIGG